MRAKSQPYHIAPCILKQIVLTAMARQAALSRRDTLKRRFRLLSSRPPPPRRCSASAGSDKPQDGLRAQLGTARLLESAAAALASESTHHVLSMTVPICREAKGREISTDYWERLNDKLQFSLGAGPVYWQQPSDPQRLRLFCKTIDELRSQCEMEGLEP